MAKVPNAVEILPKIWTAWVGRTNVTDDTTDRQTTDGRAISYSERERELTSLKSYKKTDIDFRCFATLKKSKQ